MTLKEGLLQMLNLMYSQPLKALTYIESGELGVIVVDVGHTDDQVTSALVERVAAVTCY